MGVIIILLTFKMYHFFVATTFKIFLAFLKYTHHGNFFFNHSRFRICWYFLYQLTWSDNFYSLPNWCWLYPVIFRCNTLHWNKSAGWDIIESIDEDGKNWHCKRSESSNYSWIVYIHEYRLCFNLIKFPLI